MLALYIVVPVILPIVIAIAVNWLRQPVEQNLNGRLRVIDGDTIAAGDTRIRIFGIDTPERGQAGADRATAVLHEILQQGAVTMTPLEKDCYGRTVGKLTVNGHDVGAAMVEMGFARASGAYASLERRARRNRNGLWASMGGMPDPEAWRACNLQ